MGRHMGPFWGRFGRFRGPMGVSHGWGKDRAEQGKDEFPCGGARRERPGAIRWTAVNAPTHIIGVDPGLSSGGIVLLRVEDDCVIAADKFARIQRGTTAESYPGADKAFADANRIAMRRAVQLAERVGEWHAQVGVGMIALESFVDQASRGRALIKERWTTPLVIGHLAARLADIGYSEPEGTLVFQDAGMVLRHFQSELARMQAGEPGITPGQEHLANEHMRSAWAHAAWLALRIRDGQVRR